MTDRHDERGLSSSTRRHILKLLVAGLIGSGAACAPAPPASPTVTPIVVPPADVVDPRDAALSSLRNRIARERTLMLVWDGQNGQYVDQTLWNPYTPGANHQNGPGLFYEPLAFYSVFADEEILHLAEHYAYSTDFMKLRITTRSGASWSDGRPFGAADVAYTLSTLQDLGSQIQWGLEVNRFLQSISLVDPLTLDLSFTQPCPRFFDFLTYQYDLGVQIVPQHIFQGRDWTTFDHYDPGQGWPVTNSPWQVALSTSEQKVIDRRSDWWAATAGVAALPRVERIVYRPYPDCANQAPSVQQSGGCSAEQLLAEELVANRVDCATGLEPATFPLVLRNPRIITHSGRKPPYGYVDWWTSSLFVNTKTPPFDDPDVRWALSYFLDRQLIVDEGLGGMGSASPLPLPPYPHLEPYTAAVADLLSKYPTTEFNPDKGAARLSKKGWSKASGTWIDKDGLRLQVPIQGSIGAIGAVVEKLLRRQGVDATFSQPPDADSNFERGAYIANVHGHGGSVRDPYFTLLLYHSRSIGLKGAHQVNFSGWQNPAFDAIVDRVAATPMSDTDALVELFHQAMTILLPELPDIQLTQFYHRIPMNETYWTGWPDAANHYVNGAFWHLTFPLILGRLQPAR